MIRYSFDLDSFVRDHLHGDWRSLADLSLTEMQYSPHLYGFPLDFKDCDETGFMWEIYNRIWGLERMSESPFGGRARGVPIHAVSPFREAFPVELLNRNHRQGHDSPRGFQIGEVGLMFTDESYPG